MKARIGTIGILLLATSMVSAGDATDPQVAAPKPKVSALVFADVGTVEFDAPPAETIIRYTLDGTTPSGKSYAYCTPLRIAESLMITAACFKGDVRCSPPVTVDCARWAEPAGAEREPGLYVTFADGAWSELPVMSTLAAAEVAPTAGFSGEARTNLCAVQFDGFIQIKREGMYTFSIDGKGPKMLSIGTARVVKDNEPGMIALRAGTYPIRAAFLHSGAAPGIFMEGPELAKQKIPAEMLSRSKQRPVSGISVSTTMTAHKFYKPELAVDGRSGTFFWTSKGLTDQDSFTLTFAKPQALNDVEIVTGKPEGGDRLEKGVLEISEDGSNFNEAAKFRYGMASAALKDKSVKALRIRSTGGQGWLAIREIYLNAKAPALSGKPTAAINLDYSGAPELKDWALRAQKDAVEQYPIICECLGSEGYVAPRQIMFIFKVDKGIAWTVGQTITYTEGWIKAHPDDTGTVVHELTHVIQAYSGKNPGWLVEGVADYIRWFNWEPLAKRPRVNPARAKYTNGYQDTAAFLVWIEKSGGDKEFVCKANKAMREGSFSMEIFKSSTGKDLETLWKEFVETYKP